MNQNNLPNNAYQPEQEIFDNSHSEKLEPAISGKTNLIISLIFISILSIAGNIYLMYQNNLLVNENKLLNTTITTDENDLDLSTNTLEDSNVDLLIVQEEIWNNYTLPDEKLSFSYPSDWKLEISNFETGNQEWEANEYKITSTNNFVLKIRTKVDGLGGGCTEECQKMNTPNQTLGTLHFYNQPLYIVLNGFQPSSEFNTNGNIRFNVIPKQTCFNNLCYGFPGTNTHGETIITGEFLSNDDLQQNIFMTAEEFTNSSDVKTAIKILESLKY